MCVAHCAAEFLETDDCIETVSLKPRRSGSTEPVRTVY